MIKVSANAEGRRRREEYGTGRRGERSSSTPKNQRKIISQKEKRKERSMYVYR
jgi:hypothetical protein